MTNKRIEKRFSGELGREYELFQKAVPYHEEFQDTVGNTIGNFAEKIEGETIKVLEAGCGTGITSIRILKADPRIKLTTVDNEITMINQAKETLSDFSNCIEFVLQDILAYLEEAESNSFDIFASAYTLHNLQPEYRERIMKEIYRVLKNGGLFINADKYTCENEEEHQRILKEQFEAFDVFEKEGYAHLKDDWIKHYIEDDKIRFKELDQIKILNDLGFKNVKKIFRQGTDAIIIAEKI